MRTPLGQATIADLVSDVASPSDGDRLIAVAWRGGFPVTGDLEVASFSLSWDGGRKVQGQATVEIVDPDGTLTPFNLDDPLAAGGSRLKLVYHYGVSGNQVDLGWWRIRHPEAHMTWQPYRRGAAEYWMSGSGGITVQADEETATVDLHL
ncbi:MAG: hypothetical protein LBH13_06650, partial [Cellulomonadaceae bacterium]|nr:hypothetical protein [Cellulomonadaceae bacterium]